MKTQTILFDLDDTLIHCNKYFIQVLDQFADWMQLRFEGLTREDVLQKQLELDLAGVERYGLKKERFPDSLVETYEFYMDRAKGNERASLAEKIYLKELGHEVYDQQFEPYPHMEKTLQELQRQGHTLCLYTGGDAGVQQEKVAQLGLKSFFGERIFISEFKNTATLQQILSQQGSDYTTTWMIGNSSRTDILPALEAGIHAIFIPSEQEWAYNQVDINIEPQGELIELKHLKEVPAVIHAFATGNALTHR